MRPIYDCHVHMTEFNFKKSVMTLDVLADMGTERAALLSLTYKSSAYNLWLLHLKEKYKRMKLSVLGMINNRDIYENIPFEVQAKALMDMGCDGIKIMYNPIARKALGYGVDDERYERMFDYLEENDIPVLMHINDPESYWVVRELTEHEKMRDWGYFKEGFLTKEEIYRETFKMLDKHPRLRVILAHFFFLSNDLAEAERVMQTYPNVSFDLTPGWEMYVGFSKDIPAWREFFLKYSDRIFFGTDSDNEKKTNAEIHLLVRQALTHGESEFMMPCYTEKMIRGLSLPDDVLDKIFYKNYERFFGEPKAVNTDMVKSCASRVLVDMKQSENLQDSADLKWLCSLISE